jgi:hypothetical protein
MFERKPKRNNNNNESNNRKKGQESNLKTGQRQKGATERAHAWPFRRKKERKKKGAGRRAPTSKAQASVAVLVPCIESNRLLYE